MLRRRIEEHSMKHALQDWTKRSNVANKTDQLNGNTATEETCNLQVCIQISPNWFARHVEYSLPTSPYQFSVQSGQIFTRLENDKGSYGKKTKAAPENTKAVEKAKVGHPPNK
ncbi:hypothetical protein M8J77_026177 [Diaphorina citri]|nr:hypothetical protein M8J77_026177 [Diaphorina citri]